MLVKNGKAGSRGCSAAKVKQISLSNNTIKRRISDMAKDVTVQVIQEIKGSPMFSFQLDETTDVSSCAQLLLFVRYINSGDFKEEFLFCSELDSTTKSADVMKKMTTFFESAQLESTNVCGVCTDGAPSMLGSQSGFQTQVKELAPKAKGTHCFIHSYAIASKTLPAHLKDILNSVVKIVNFIKAGGLSSRQFKELCKDMNSTHETLLFHTAVRWLSKGNVLNRVYEMKDEIQAFLEFKNKREFLSYFNDDKWMNSLAYLADIFEKLNCLNLKLQGKDTNIIQLNDNVKAFVSKLKSWQRKVHIGNIAMFDRLSSVSCIEETGEEFEDLKKLIVAHLQSMECEFQRCFPELEEQEAILVQNPFSASLDASGIPDEIQDQYFDLKNDSSARILYHEKSLSQFWCEMYDSYPQVSKLAFQVLLPFATTYLCESGFSALLHMKTKERNRMNVEDDMRLALSSTQPRVSRLAADVQGQPSH